MHLLCSSMRDISSTEISRNKFAMLRLLHYVYRTIIQLSKSPKQRGLNETWKCVKSKMARAEDSYRCCVAYKTDVGYR